MRKPTQDITGVRATHDAKQQQRQQQQQQQQRQDILEGFYFMALEARCAVFLVCLITYVCFDMRACMNAVHGRDCEDWVKQEAWSGWCT